MRADLGEIKHSPGIIYTVWSELGLEGSPEGKMIRCPFHPDSKPSLSINADGTLWRCFAGCGQGSVVDLVKIALDCDTGSAIRWLTEEFGSGSMRANQSSPNNPRIALRKSLADRLGVESLLDLDAGGEAEIRALADLRGWSEAGPRLAVERGNLRFPVHSGHQCWAIGDKRSTSCQIARLDGGEFGLRDARTRKLTFGTDLGWPIGIEEARERENVLLVCGNSDFIAAHELLDICSPIQDFGVVTILGDSNRLDLGALEILRRRKVLIIPDNDKSGRRAGDCWFAQLHSVGAEAKLWSWGPFEGIAHLKDFDDYVRLVLSIGRREPVDTELVDRIYESLWSLTNGFWKGSAHEAAA